MNITSREFDIYLPVCDGEDTPQKQDVNSEELQGTADELDDSNELHDSDESICVPLEGDVTNFKDDKAPIEEKVKEEDDEEDEEEN